MEEESKHLVDISLLYGTNPRDRVDVLDILGFLGHPIPRSLVPPRRRNCSVDELGSLGSKLETGSTYTVLYLEDKVRRAKV